MADLGGFNANEVPNDFGTRSALPEGRYQVAIVDTQMKETKNNTGSGLLVTMQVIEGDYKGSTLTSFLNLQNVNVKAVEIARKELSAICHATGVMTPSDSCELHDIPIFVDVKCKKNGEFMNNNVTGYLSSQKAQEQAMPVAATTSQKKPWER